MSSITHQSSFHGDFTCPSGFQVRYRNMKQLLTTVRLHKKYCKDCANTEIPMLTAKIEYKQTTSTESQEYKKIQKNYEDKRHIFEIFE